LGKQGGVLTLQRNAGRRGKHEKRITYRPASAAEQIHRPQAIKKRKKETFTRPRFATVRKISLRGMGNIRSGGSQAADLQKKKAKFKSPILTQAPMTTCSEEKRGWKERSRETYSHRMRKHTKKGKKIISPIFQS